MQAIVFIRDLWKVCVLIVITIKQITLTDVPYQMTVGGAFVYVCERGRLKDFVASRVYI